MDAKLAIKWFQYCKLLLRRSIGDRRNGFQNRNDLLLLFAAAEKAVKVFRSDGTRTVFGFDGPIGLNLRVNGASGNLVLLADFCNRLSVVIPGYQFLLFQVVVPHSCSSVN